MTRALVSALVSLSRERAELTADRNSTEECNKNFNFIGCAAFPLAPFAIGQFALIYKNLS
jgi:hypothetical protein